MREDRLTSSEQLLKGMLITLHSSIYGQDDYWVDCEPYIRQCKPDTLFVKLTHTGSKTSMEYSLNELGITQRSYTRWVETSMKKIVDIE